MAEARSAAAILAAGFSTRMGGRPKALCALGGETLLAHTAASLRAGGIERVFVVTGHEAGAVERHARELGLEPVLNADFASGMFSSVRTALGVATELRQCEAFLLTPVDAALFLPRSVATLCAATAEDGASAFVPEFMERPGHPVCLRRPLFASALAWDGNDGLRGCLARLEAEHPESIRRVPLPDAGLLADIDRPEDLLAAESFLDATKNRSLPAFDEALQLLRLSGLGEEKIRHSVLTALGAVRLALALGGKDSRFACEDFLLHAGAGLVHDIARKLPRHASVGADILRGLGWERTALVVACHPHPPAEVFTALDLAADVYADTYDMVAFPPDADACLLSAALCVNVADKHCLRNGMVSLEERFAPVKARFAHDPLALSIISGRERAAAAINDRLRELLGEDVRAVLRRRSAHPLDAALSAVAEGG